jgi:BirA family biotin operon repressor/biotin-[acetyl-CoA-carboxylase] ligase
VSGPPTQLGHPRVHLRSVDSTNERARALAIAGAPHGTLVTAAEQSAGRGRQGRRWSAPRGRSLLMSLVLREPPASLPLAAAVAVCDVAGPETRIKWPNDVVLERPVAVSETVAENSAPTGDGVAGNEAAAGNENAAGNETAHSPTLAKLAGILIEGRPQQGWAVLGIGFNVAVRIAELAPELRATAATLGLEPPAIEPLLARLLAALQRRLQEPPAQTLADWRARDALRGREIAWSSGRGRAEGIDGDGRLIVALAGGGHTTLAAGEVHLTPIH